MEDNELIEEYLNGDEKSFEKLYEKYKIALFNFIFYMVRDKELANDLLQEVFIKVIDNISEYRNENFKAWIFLIARNKIYDYFKSNKTKFEQSNISIDEEVNGVSYKDILESEDTPQKILLEKIENEVLYKAIDTLKEEYREIIYLKHFSQLSFQEISKMLNIPIGTLLSRFKRAIDKLSEILLKMQ
ncbi:MAG: RNA polymerase sigma factor [Elusimicrobiota bacterium]